MRPLIDLARALADGRESATSLIEASLQAIKDPKGQGEVVFLDVFEADARQEAEAIDRLRASGRAQSPLAGVPLAVKALFDVEGRTTTAGALAGPAPALADAAVVAASRCQGLIPIGHANMTEFAYSGLGLNPHYGTPLSPWRREERRIAGGSTSGGAAAVADGMAAIALGSDTGGSCRIPAAFCNLVGFKPTQARIDRRGMAPLSTTLDTVGWIVQTVACSLTVDHLLTNSAPSFETPSLADLDILVPRNLVLDDLTEDVAASFDRLLAALSRCGARVRSQVLPELDTIAHLNRLGGFSAYESYMTHRKDLPAAAGRYDPRVLSRIERGMHQSEDDYKMLLEGRRQLIARFVESTRGGEIVVFPTVPIVPPRLDALEADDDYYRTNLLVLRNSSVVNMVDGCAITLPLNPLGTPVGLTLCGPAWRDAKVHAAALAIERMLALDDVSR